MKCLVLIYFLLFFSDVNASTDYEYLLKIINSELGEVSRLNKQIKASDENLLLRMAELYLERGRVKKEKENDKFLKLPPHVRRKAAKSKYFSGSKKDMEQANRIGVFLLKKFPNSSLKGDVFYIFAFYAQEYKSIKKAKKFFNLAKKYSEKKTESFKKASLALADIFYNEKKFLQAINNYENAIEDKESKWWTRDAFNLAWCYFREGRQKEGIKLMENVHSLSKKGFYLNFANEAERDLIYFYIESNRITDAERFIRKSGEKPQQYIKLAKNLIDQGKGSKAIFFLDKAQKKVLDPSEDAEVNNMLLDLHEKFGNTRQHLSTSKKQFAFYLEKQLDPIFSKNLKYHLKKMTASIQEKIKSRRYQNKKKYERELSSFHHEYTDILKKVFPRKSSSFIYFQAEIDYVIGNYEQAAQLYYKVLNSRNRRIKKIKILNNLLACLANLNSKSKFYQKNAKFIYENYISIEKNPSKKKPVYPLLFSLYVKNNSIIAAEKILDGYNKAFKNDMRTIESMLATILENPAIKNDKSRFLSYVQKINKKEFIISTKLASAIKNNALSLQFKGVQKDSTRGQKANALRGYKLIYDDPLSSREAKKNAAFNIAVLFHELKYPSKTATWITDSLVLMNKGDAKKLVGTMRRISMDLFNQGHHTVALKIMIKLANKLCEDTKEFRNLASDYFKFFLISSNSPRLSTAKFYRCIKDKSFYDNLVVKSYEYFFLSNDYEFIYKNLKKTLKRKESTSVEELRAAKNVAMYFSKKQLSKAKVIAGLVEKKYSKGFAKQIYFKEIMAIKRYLKYSKTRDSIFAKKLIFPEKVFNKRLQNKIKKLSSLSSLIVNDATKGGVIMIGPMYELLIESYDKIISNINNFQPVGKSSSYITGFKKSMSSLVNNLGAQRLELVKNLNKLVNEKNIVTKLNYDYSLGETRHGLLRPKFEPWIISDREH